MTKLELFNMQRGNLVKFLVDHKIELTGRTLDFGAGKQLYKNYTNGSYVAYDPKYEEISAKPEGTFSHGILAVKR